MSEKKNLDIFSNSNIGKKLSYIEDSIGEIDYNENNEKDYITNESVKEFNESDLEEFIGNFTHYADENTSNKIDWEKFDYNIYTKDYYEKKFPGFDESVHEILAECSKKKIQEHRENKLKKEVGDFIVRFD